MNNVSTATDIADHQTLRLTLLEIASDEDERAATEAARVPYWAPVPDSVLGHREAARALRVVADRLCG